MNICLSWRRSSLEKMKLLFLCILYLVFFVCLWSLTILGRKTEKSEGGLKAVADRRLLESLFDSLTPGQSCMSLRDEIDWGLWLEDGDVGEDVAQSIDGLKRVGLFPCILLPYGDSFAYFFASRLRMPLVRIWRERGDRVESDFDIVKTDWYVAIRSSSALVHFTRRRRERQDPRERRPRRRRQRYVFDIQRIFCLHKREALLSKRASSSPWFTCDVYVTASTEMSTFFFRAFKRA